MMDNSKRTDVERATDSIDHQLPWFTRLAYSVGHIQNDLCASMWFTYLLVYQHSVLNFSNSIAGYLILIGQVADALATPFVGLEADKSDDFLFCKYGRRKTWHLVGTLCVLGSFPFLFTECVGCSTSHQYAQFVYYAAFIILFQFGWASCQISHLSLIPELTPISHERTELVAYRNASTVMSNIFVYSIAWLFLGVSHSKERKITSHDAPVFKNIMFTVFGTGMIFSIIFHLFVKEPSQTSRALKNVADDNNVKENTCQLKWSDWFKEPIFYKVGGIYMATRLFVNLSQIYMPLYLLDGLHLAGNSIAIIPLVIYLSGFISSFFMKFLGKKLGHKMTYLIACLFGITGTLWLFFGEGHSFSHVQIYIIAVFLGVAGSTMLISALSFSHDMIGQNTSAGGFVFGALSFTDKLSNGLAVVIIQDIHPCISCCQDCQWYYLYVLVFSCGGAVVVALLGLASIAPYKLEVAKKNVQRICKKNDSHSGSVQADIENDNEIDETSPLLE